MHDDLTVVSDLVARALEHRDETGTEINLAQLCEGRPDLQTQVEVALEAATRLPMLQSAGIGGLPVLGDELRGRYRIDQRLGAGAMGVVYAAKDLELGRKVAIKVLHHGVMERGQALARFEREAEALAAVRQENVVTIYDRGFTQDNAPFLIMELVEGVPLSRVLDLAQGRTKVGEADDTQWLKEALGLTHVPEPSFLRQSVRWVAEVASGLEAVHDAGIVHRDVKPSNIMIRWDGRPVILDFGAVVTDAESDLTRTGAAVGTPAYMAPESLEGNEVSLPASDVYGLTATLYHLVTRKAPYEGSPTQILASLASREPVPAARIARGLPKDMQAILDQGMARKATRRFPSAAALRADLHAFLAYQPVSARRISSVERIARRVYRSRAARGGIVVAAAGLGLLGWSLWSEAREVRRDAEFADVFLHVPANFGVMTYANRVVAVDEMTADLAALFDRLVETRGEPIVGHLLRAAFRLDHGDPQGAAADMDALARECATPFATELAKRYERLEGDASSARALDLAELPEPGTSIDRYLAAFHAMRQLNYKAAGPLLADEGLGGLRHAQELKLLLTVIPIPRMEWSERFVAAGAIYEEAIRIESRFGGRSSMSAHLAGYGLSAQERYREALPICREGLELAPAAHSTSVNAARDAHRCDAPVEAQKWLEHSMALLPLYPKAFETGLFMRLAKDDFDGARAWLEEMPYARTRRDQRAKVSWQIRIETAQATRDLVAGDDGAAATRAQVSLGLIEKLGDSLAGEIRTYASVCEAIVAGDKDQVYELLCQRQIKDPLRHRHLRTMLSLMPGELNEETRLTTRAVFVALADALAHERSSSEPVSEPAR